MKRYLETILLFLLLGLPGMLLAENMVDQAVANEKEKTWWEKRKDIRPDLYYPHKLHMPVMEQGGDACMLCHSFMKNEIREPEVLKSITRIANEPLKAICHECHVVNISAPSRCDVCHKNMMAIRPPDHGRDYTRIHAEESRHDQKACEACHVDLSFCTDCHFRRDSSRHRVHALGYLASHGIESRIDPAACGRCHNPDYCSDCHRSLP